MISINTRQTCLLSPSPQLLRTQTSTVVVHKAYQQHKHTVNHPRKKERLIYATLFSNQLFTDFRKGGGGGGGRPKQTPNSPQISSNQRLASEEKNKDDKTRHK